MVQKKKDMIYKKIYENPFINKLLISITIATFMFGVVLGIIGGIHIQTSHLLILFAILFVISSVFFENRGINKLHSLIWGFIIALITVFSIITFIGGVLYIFNGAIDDFGYELLISAFAICMVISMILFNVITQNQ